MEVDEIITWLKKMQNPMISETELYCAESCYGSGKMVYPDPEDYALDEAINALQKLKEYKQLEEQGKLIELPCKAGTDVYYILGIPNETPCTIDRCTFSLSDRHEIGKTLFLTKSEAEAKLQELRGNQDGKV